MDLYCQRPVNSGDECRTHCGMWMPRGISLGRGAGLCWAKCMRWTEFSAECRRASTPAIWTSLCQRPADYVVCSKLAKKIRRIREDGLKEEAEMSDILLPELKVGVQKATGVDSLFWTTIDRVAVVVGRCYRGVPPFTGYIPALSHTPLLRFRGRRDRNRG